MGWALAVVDLETMVVRSEFDPAAQKLLPKDSREAAVSLGVAIPHEARGAAIVVVGVIPNFRVETQAFDRNSLPMIRTFKLDRGVMTPLHATTVNDIPGSFTSLQQSTVVAAVGKSLRCYTLGSKQLLLKTELRDLAATRVASLASSGQLIAVGDARCGVTFVKYFGAPRDGTGGAVLVAVAETPVPRSVKSLVFVDHLTCAVADI